MKKYSAIAAASILAANLLTFPSISLAEIENKTKQSMDVVHNEMLDDIVNKQNELQKKLEDIKKEKVELQKQQYILTQEKELFVKLDDLKKQQEELLKQKDRNEQGEYKQQQEEIQKKINELKKQQEELQKKKDELEPKGKINDEKVIQNQEETDQNELEQKEEQKKREEMKKQEGELQKKQDELKKQQEELEQKLAELKQQEDVQKKEAELKQQQHNQEENMQASPRTFPDVPEWAQESVNYLVNKNVLTGMPDGNFSPNLVLDRASAATIMAKILGLEIHPEEKPSFKDSQNHWATPYIAAVEKAGVIKGEGNGNFNPSGEITRAAMASMLVQAYQLDAKISGELPTLFTDLKGHWGERYANILVGLGISNGIDNNWKPDKSVTRAEAAQFVAMTDTSKDKEVKLKKINMDKSFFTYNGPSLSSGIAYEYEPQPVTVYEEREGGWIRIYTGLGFKWVCLNEKKINIDKKFFTYNGPSLSSGIAYEYEPQPVTVYEEREGGWIRIGTGLGLKWVCLNERKIDINRSFITYNEPSLSSGIAYEYEPQPVTVYEEREGGWARIGTGLGLKWVLLNEKRAYIDRNFITYNTPSRSGVILDNYGPQTVTVIEEQGTWIRIRTYAGYQWLDTKRETRDLSRVFFAYDNPNFSSRVSGKYGPQTVEVYEEGEGGWIQIQTDNGPKWVNASYVNSNQVILNVPSLYQFPELNNGCEVVSLQMLVEHYIGRSLNKVIFAFEMPFDTTRLQKYNGKFQVWGDPDVGFVGDVTGNTPGYSINPEPLKQLLDKYARGTNLTGNDFSVLENYVRNGKPVVTWVTVALNNPRETITWTTPEGKTIYARMNTHAVVLTGVDDNYVYYNDPFYGTKNVRASKDWFVSIYNQMGKKSLSID
ncbi:S-layer homology domain-containing protein [Bacillus sp. NPDC094106]|uniref:S-layer homology domain-containing protein n=1 Tax=Bacillus sp. NPDC094106 TaxID=3363949 RepID=UPI00381ADC7D